MPTRSPLPYTGRFAPSPTGPLHFGSLLAACASYLQARVAGGKWLLRIEDIDPPREQAGASEAIIDVLEAYGFEWDGQVRYQSTCAPRHKELVEELLGRSLAYPCSCTRSDLAGARRGPLGPIYPGTCRRGFQGRRVAIRVLTDNEPVSFVDGLQGLQTQTLELETGDFVVQRRDGLIAYHLAVVADDHDQGVNEIVRGIDLMDSTPRQVHLQRLLGFTTPNYLHIPVVANELGQKLSKQTGAPGLRKALARPTLVAALRALAQTPPDDLVDGTLDQIWRWAFQHWDITRLTARRSIALRDYPLATRENGLS